MRVFVTGASGLLGAAIIREFDGNGADVAAFDRAALDVTDPDAVERAVQATRPDVVINCAAYNDVDGAEDDATTALRVNAFAVRSLSDAARAAGARLVHYSTDFVFDGETTQPYVEDDRPNPRAVYGASKLLGDWFALENPAAYVLRVESLFGAPGPGRTRQGSLGVIVARIRAGEPVPAFTDRVVSPTCTSDIATATRALIEGGQPYGLYHCVNSGAATWAEVATEAARVLDLPITVKGITLESVALKAPRPKYCALSNVKLEAAGIRMPSWQAALRQYLAGA